MPSFVVDRPGTYVAQLIVNDGTVNSAPDTVTISTLNSAPVANAGPDQAVSVGQAVGLDGSASSDVDGDPLTFSWALTSAPAAELVVADGRWPSALIRDSHVAQQLLGTGGPCSGSAANRRAGTELGVPAGEAPRSHPGRPSRASLP